MIYLKEFENQAAYVAAESSLLTPNVALIAADGKVKYKKGEQAETRVIAKVNAVWTDDPIEIIGEYSENPFSAIEIDGVEVIPVVSAYTFSTTGEHTVKYTLTDPTKIDAYSFNTCAFINSIVIPNSVTNIDIVAFQDCGITSINIPDNVISIGVQSFKNCGNLTNITIGNGVTSIGSEAFVYCDNITSITINATTPPTLGSSALGYDSLEFPIYVPADSVDAYKAASGWSDYASRIKAIQ